MVSLLQRTLPRCRRITVIGCLILMMTMEKESARADVSGMAEIVGGLDNPVFVTHAPGDDERLFILEESGDIRVFDFNTGLQATPFLSISDVDTTFEGGLLGLAFHPQYSTPGAPGEGKLYTYATIDDNNQPEPFESRIQEYTVSSDPNVADPTPREILRWQQPQANHNGGWIGFSPLDNFLYINFGDGGGDDDNDEGHSTDPPDAPGNAQDITNNWLGKTLRIDVNGDDFDMDDNRNYAIPAGNPFAGVDDMGEAILGDDEIWAYGLRNPYRASFDRLTGDFWIGDVGQNTLEEVDYQPADRTDVANYGWRLREGDIPTPSGGVGGSPPANNVEPVYVYDRGTGEFQGFTVIGGYVYRGPDPELQGLYFFADAGSANVWTFDPDSPLATRDNVNAELGALHAELGQPVSFGEDSKGNLYLVDYGSNETPTGQIFRIVTDAFLAGDYDRDGDVDGADYQTWKNAYGESGGPADGNGDGAVNAADYTVWRNNLGGSVHDLGAASSSGGNNVPEPISCGLAVQLSLLLAAGYRRSRGEV